MGYCLVYLRSRLYSLNFFSASNGEVNEKSKGELCDTYFNWHAPNYIVCAFLDKAKLAYI